MEKARATCLECDRIAPAGHGGVKSYDAMGERLVHRERACIDREPRGQVTPLPPDAEETIAEVFRRWCALDVVDVLLMVHVANGGSCATFGAFLLRVRAAIERAQPARRAFRATAWSKFQRLVRSFAPFVKGKLHAWDDGHGGAIRKEREEAERQPDLFDGIENV